MKKKSVLIYDTVNYPIDSTPKVLGLIGLKLLTVDCTP